MRIFAEEVELDPEWVELIEEALNLGLSADEIRSFLKTSKRPE